MKKGIIFSIISAAVISLIIQFLLFDGFDKNALESLNINFLAGIIGIFFTYLIIDNLLENNEKNRKKKFIHESIKNEYTSVLNVISHYYISFITKMPPQLTKEIDTYDKVITNLLDDINEYIDGNFIRNNITVIQPTIVNGVVESQNRTFGYQEFCILTKQNIKKTIDNFLIKYSSFIPDEVIINLSNINNSFMQPIFTTALEHGLPLDVSNATFNPRDFQEPLKEIGVYILNLYKYA